MKKALIVALMFVMLAGVSLAKNLPKGTREIDVQGSFDGNMGAGFSLFLALGYGYFPVDKLEVCVAAAVMHTDAVTLYAPAVSVQYNFDLGSGNNIVPFVGANIGWGFMDYHPGVAENGFVYGIEAGVKYFVVKNLAINLSVDRDWATGKLFDDKNANMIDNNLTVNLGLRFFF
jgi:hypothetical protein